MGVLIGAPWLGGLFWGHILSSLMGYPWVTSFLINWKLPVPPSYCITIVSQFRYQFDIKCAPVDYLYHIDHSMSVQFYSLNSFCASMSSKPQPSSWKLCCHNNRIILILTLILESITIHILSVSQDSLALVLETSKTRLAIHGHQDVPNLTRHNPIFCWTQWDVWPSFPYTPPKVTSGCTTTPKKIEQPSEGCHLPPRSTRASSEGSTSLTIPYHTRPKFSKPPPS